uniref:SOWAHA-C winged helix-turn-helix domain-containing protein n=1 Tax=Gadus morhua TaxID=8049 RepID=A0A8C5BP61_GADMO
MGDVTEESLLDYFYSTGGDSGKVKNADLLKTYKPYIGHTDLQLRAKYREEFKLIMDRIAVMKSENVSREYCLSLLFIHTCALKLSILKSYLSTEAYFQQQILFPFYCVTNLKVTTNNKYIKQLYTMAQIKGYICLLLDPIEKDWIYSAASARVPDLSQLLQQDPSLANKKVTALHWAAKHGKEDMATLVVKAGADVNTKSGYTPLHIAALHGHQHMVELLVQTYGAKKNLRDYSGHLASQYLTDRDPDEPGEESETPAQARERGRNRKLPSLFLSKKKWGSAEELAPIEEERSTPPQPLLPAYRPRKFSR